MRLCERVRANPWSVALRACGHADTCRPTGEHKPGNDRTSSVAASSISGSRIAFLNSLSNSGDTAHRRTRMFPLKRSTARTRGEGFQEQTVAWQKPLTLNFSSILRGCQTDSLQSRNFEAQWQAHRATQHQLQGKLLSRTQRFPAATSARGKRFESIDFAVPSQRNYLNLDHLPASRKNSKRSSMANAACPNKQPPARSECHDSSLDGS